MGDSKGDGDQSSSSKRRSRAPNYTEKEIRILVNLVFAHIDIIESKKTDSETWRVKDIMWNNIAETFNNYPGVTKRTVEMIRQKYDSLKKIARKKDAKNKEEESKIKPEFVDLEDYEKELLTLLETHGGGNTSQTYETTTVIFPETKFADTNTIKTETSNVSSNPLNVDLDDFRDEERFIVTDEDMLWEMPSDTVNRPRLHLVKRQLEQLEREEQRQIAEHKYRMRSEEIKRKLSLAEAKRAKIEHQKKMELLELDIELKRKALAEIA